MNLGNGHAALEALIDCKQTLVILRQNFFSQLFHTHRRHFLHVQAVLGDLCAADCFHERLLKVAADRHNLAGCLHLGTQLPASVNEFIKWPFREFNRYIVKGRLEACHRLAGYLVRDLVQMITDRNLGCHAGNRISGCFRSKGGRTGYTRVYLDNGIFKALRIQRKLAVAAALDAHRLDNIQRCGTKHLVFLIRQRHSRCDNNGVAGVDADRVKVFHRADRNLVADGIAHYLKLDLLPSGNTFLNQNLIDR